MKKEKTIRTYQRRTKSGKLVTVKQHTAKYDAAEKAKEAAKKKGAGNELEAKMKRLRLKELIGKELPEEEVEKKVLDEDEKEAKKKGKIRPVGTGTNGPEPKKTSKAKASKTATSKSKKTESADSNSAFTAAEFKEWYHGTGSAADKKVAKALRAQLGRAGYRKLEDEAIDNYSSRGHLSMFKRVSGGSEAKTKASLGGKAGKSTEPKVTSEPKHIDLHDQYEFEPSVRKKLDSLIKKIDSKRKTWLSKYNGLDFNGGRRFRESLNALEEEYNNLFSQHGPETPAYKKYKTDLKAYYDNKRKQEAAEKRASRRKVSSASKELYEKYGTSRKEVNDYVKTISGGKRQWKWDAEKGKFHTSRMPDGRPMRGDSYMSLESAIKKMQRAQSKSTSKDTTSGTKSAKAASETP